MPSVYDVIVLGTGTMGAAACAELARRGLRVLGIDRFEPPHRLGSHHGATRLFRKAYYEHPDYVPLLHRAAALWERMNAESGRPIFVRTGALYVGPGDGALIRGTIESARRHGLAVEELAGSAAAARFPVLRIPDGQRCVLDHDGAVIMCEEAVEHFVRAARAAGANLRTGEEVSGWEERDGEVLVRAGAAEYCGKALVVTCGAGTAGVLAGLRERLLVTRQVLGWVRPLDEASFAPARFPAWAFENGDGSLHYGAPMMPGERGVKVARHARGPAVDPDLVDREVGDGDRREIIDGAERCLAGVDAGAVEARVCLYTNSPDSHFIVGRLPGAERVFIACGFSGHGFKFAPVIGEILADLATRGTTDHRIGFLGPERFAGRTA